MGSEGVRIAVVQSMCGHLTCVGPDDFKREDCTDAMSAAIGWHIEAGYMPAAQYWIEVRLPALPVTPTIQGEVIR